MRGAALIVAVLCMAVTASADESAVPTRADLGGETLLTLDHKWPAVPDDRAPSMEDRITDHVTDWANHVGSEMETLTHHHAQLRIDGRRRRAELHLGGGNEHLAVDFDSHWLFADGKAYAKVKLDLALEGHHVELELPDMDVSRDSYHGESLTQVNVSVLERRF